MANSRQRRKKKRANGRAVRERFWFIAEHPLLASGVGAMLLTGIATEISGWTILAAAFYVAALLLLLVVFLRADLFRANRKLAWTVITLSILAEFVLWIAIRPEPALIVEQISRIEFQMESRQRVYKAGLVIKLNRAMTADEIGAFIVGFRLVKPLESKFMAACRDFRFYAQPRGESRFGTQTDLWDGDVNTRETASEFPKEVTEIECLTNYPADTFTPRTLDSFDGDSVDAVMTARLAPFISEIDLIINDFVLVSVTDITLQDVVSPDTFYNSDYVASEYKALVWQKIKVGEPNGPFGFRDQTVLDFDAKPPGRRQRG